MNRRDFFKLSALATAAFSAFNPLTLARPISRAGDGALSTLKPNTPVWMFAHLFNRGEIQDEDGVSIVIYHYGERFELTRTVETNIATNLGGESDLLTVPDLVNSWGLPRKLASYLSEFPPGWMNRGSKIEFRKGCYRIETVFVAYPQFES